MNKFFFAFVILATFFTGTFSQADPGKVYICHFGQKHTSEAGDPDYLTMIPDPSCTEQGGRILYVSCRGAERGHGVANACKSVSD